ncbi:glycosyltransferase family 4 protein [Flavobacterium phragmitis]|uniref:Glycosyltransferase involved in cell wall bisynthesis n=1 Tax=Flavobacterium phragmitis TaxID=739143 RepID=A0A1I1UPT5_9FLAO|nr:glycosyltransferase family 4 protein [Flavobacterium phragmitis]SFD72787.1 Glycosyltransferase involved in cell wall bisynthesis [Flavobacterium phragmitis]
MKKILFISHQNSLSGAPLILLYFIQWLRKNCSNYQIDLLVLSEGKLSGDFKKSVKNYYSINDLKNKLIFQNQYPSFLKVKIDNLLNSLFIRKLKKENYDIIYGNTIVTLPIASKLKENSKSELVLHVHELSTVINLLLPNFKKLKNSVDKFIAVSDLVKNELSEKWDVEAHKVKRIYEFSKVEGIEQIKKNDTEEFVICGCGHVDWRKGIDLFIQVANYVISTNTNKKVKFIWIGKVSLNDKLVIEADLQKMGLFDFVDFIGEILNPHEYLKKCDVFLLTSREDPFPLVCIEVGLLGKPIICFDKATGISEILVRGGGFVVPYLQIDKMVEKVRYYIENPELVYKDGLLNQQNFSNFTPDLICPQIFDFLETFE